MMQRRTLLRAGVAGLAGAPFVLRAQAPVNLRMQGFLAAASPTHRAFERFAADVKTATGGRVQISTLPAGGAVAPPESLNAVANGILDGQYCAPSFFAARDPAFTLLGDTGAAYNDTDTRDAWFQQAGGVAIAREVYDKYGLYYVDQIYWPGEHIPAKKSLAGVADLKGLKIRCPPGMIAEVLGRCGAAVVNLPGAEVFNALQSGVIDATDWASPGQNLEVGLYRAARFSISAAHSMPTTEISFSKKRWEAMGKELQDLIRAEIRKMSAGLKEQIRRDDEEALKKMGADGVTIVSWSKDEIGKLREVTKRVQQELGARNTQARQVYDSMRAHQLKVGLG